MGEEPNHTTEAWPSINHSILSAVTDDFEEAFLTHQLRDFGFKYEYIFIIENRLPAVNDMESRRLRILVLRKVAYRIL